METLLGTSIITPSSPQPLPAEQQRRPGIAFGLSLLLPGAGHLYCGKVRKGLVTMAFFAAALAGTLLLNSENLFWGVAIRAALVLYVFGFLDAYFAVREINAGQDPYIVGNNPRIAATLNLLTNGLGYFYLGERKKGLILFIGLRTAGAALQKAATGEVSVGGLAFLELVYAVIAIDAYRLARKQLKECFPEETLSAFSPQPFESKGLGPALPIAVAILVAFNYVLLIVVGLSLPDYTKIDRSGEVVTATADGKSLRNAAYGIQLNVPAGWEFKTEDRTYLLEAKKFEGGCDVALIPEAKLPISSLPAHAHALADSIRAKNPAFTLQSERASTLGGRPAYELLFAAKYDETEVMQRYVLSYRGLTLHTFVATAATVFMDDCGPEMQRMQEQINLSR